MKLKIKCQEKVLTHKIIGNKSYGKLNLSVSQDRQKELMLKLDNSTNLAIFKNRQAWCKLFYSNVVLFNMDGNPRMSHNINSNDSLPQFSERYSRRKSSEARFSQDRKFTNSKLLNYLILIVCRYSVFSTEKF